MHSPKTLNGVVSCTSRENIKENKNILNEEAGEMKHHKR